MRHPIPTLCALLVSLGLLGGCATNRSTMQLALPLASAPAAANGRVVVIDRVSDQRHFEDDPDDPSVPSLKKGEAYRLDAEQRKIAIARKRNTWGKAIGDIVLDGGQTIETLTRDLVRAGFEQRGWRVADAASASPPDALHVAVDVREFWAWFTPGMWTVDMEAKIGTLLAFAPPSTQASLDVSAYGKKSAPTGADDNWRQAYDRAFADYAAKLAQALAGAGF